MILDSLGKHTELNMLNSQSQAYTIFPSTTADVVYLNDNKVTLEDFVPSSTNNLTNLGEPFTILEIAETVNLSNTVLAALVA